MNFNTLRTAVVATALLIGAALPAQAAMLTWKLSGVQFTDGSAATGSVNLEDTGSGWKVGSFSVSTFDGALSGYTYNNNNSYFYEDIAGNNVFFLIDKSYDRYFNFSFTSPLLATGGESSLSIGSFECANCSPIRYVTAGSLTTLDAAEVPEPSTGALLLPALAMMGWMARRRKHLVAK